MKVEIKLDSGCRAVSCGGIICTGVGYTTKNGGCGGGHETRESALETIETFKKSLTKEGYTPIVVDERSTQTESNPKAKFDLMWRWNEKHEKKHYTISWNNYSDFGDMVGKTGAFSCCDWDAKNKLTDEHELIPVMDKIKEVMIKKNGINCECEIENEGFEHFSSCEERWNYLGRANAWHKKLVESCGFEENVGMSCTDLKDVKTLYNKAENKTRFRIYLKKCVDLHYEVDCRQASENGDFITEGFKPGKHDYSAVKILSIKNWVDKLK